MRRPHRRLRRLDRIWIDSPVFFITACTFRRRPILATPETAAILKDEWESAPARHGWNVARFVIMPDHAHFFCAPRQEASTLEAFVGRWKEWTAKRMIRELDCARPVWQLQFFDQLLRSEEKCVEKWDYVYLNPVRAGLVAKPEDWTYGGEIIEDWGL
jgi:REP element-mobilizing transposase RayT